MKKEPAIQNIIKQIGQGEINEAEVLLDKYSGEKTPEFWLLKGSVYQKKQKWGLAINAFQKVVESDPSNIEAKINIEIIQNILNFWNPDMLNA